MREELDRNQPQCVGFEQPPLEPQVIVVKANGDVEAQPMSDELKRTSSLSKTSKTII